MRRLVVPLVLAATFGCGAWSDIGPPSRANEILWQLACLVWVAIGLSWRALARETAPSDSPLLRCDLCGGSGKVAGFTCRLCGGTGQG